jgi:hypothetical protein
MIERLGAGPMIEVGQDGLKLVDFGQFAQRLASKKELLKNDKSLK